MVVQGEVSARAACKHVVCRVAGNEELMVVGSVWAASIHGWGQQGREQHGTLQCAAVTRNAVLGLIAETVLERIQVAPGNAEALHQVVKRGPVQGDGHVAILINNRLFALPGATTAP